MKRFDAPGTDRSRPPAVHWTVYDADGRVHAVADVPRGIPEAAIRFAATDTTAALYLGPPGSPGRVVRLPVPVNPLPESISYNNGVVEVVFSIADRNQVATSRDSPRETA